LACHRIAEGEGRRCCGEMGSFVGGPDKRAVRCACSLACRAGFVAENGALLYKLEARSDASSSCAGAEAGASSSCAAAEPGASSSCAEPEVVGRCYFGGYSGADLALEVAR